MAIAEIFKLCTTCIQQYFLAVVRRRVDAGTLKKKLPSTRHLHQQSGLPCGGTGQVSLVIGPLGTAAVDPCTVSSHLCWAYHRTDIVMVYID